jgi:hypothetical protein
LGLITGYDCDKEIQLYNYHYFVCHTILIHLALQSPSKGNFRLPLVLRLVLAQGKRKSNSNRRFDKNFRNFDL